MVIKAVIGANYGDEGKGLMTDYFCRQALFTNQRCLNVLTNGGAQRGHTVVHGNLKHVFHHFGSGTLSSADTYISDQFIINPAIFVKELEELANVTNTFPKVFINQHCKVSTPFDMMFNKILLEHNHEHNSCGLGVWETIHRYFNSLSLPYSIASDVDTTSFHSYLVNIRDCYFKYRLEEEGIDLSSDSKWNAIFYSDGIIEHFIDDFKLMNDRSTICTNPYKLYSTYDIAVMENAQGLLLDSQYDSEFGTSSRTGLSRICREIISSRISSLIDNVEVCYVTRNYLTRHGDGSFPEECSSIELGEVSDSTNVYNSCQGVLRYGRLNRESLLDRIEKDSKDVKTGLDTEISIAMTHLDQEVELEYDMLSFPSLKYISDGPDVCCVAEIES